MSSSGGKSSTPSGSSGGGGKSAGGDSADGSSGGGAAGKGGGGDGQGGQGAGPGGKSDLGRGQAIAAPDPTRASRDDDGDSPIVPILVGLAVLAAASIGVVTMRRGRQGGPPGGDSSRVSPEAG